MNFENLDLDSKPIKFIADPQFCYYGVQIKLIACGNEHSAFVTNENNIYTMGSNRCGQLGIRDQSVKENGSPILVQHMTGHRITDISCGGMHTIVATDRGEVYSWGEGRYGALGLANVVTD